MFFFLRFSQSFIQTQQAKNFDDGEWLHSMQFMLENASHQPGCILKNQTDKPVVRKLAQNMLREQNIQQIFHRKVIRQTVDTLIAEFARSILMRLPDRINAIKEESVIKILQYIHHNIYETGTLKTEEVSRELGICKNDLGRYFKKHTGETLQEYITNYKLKLV